MAVTIVSFRWLEILEKEFDKSFVDLDLLIGDLDAEEPDFVHAARQKLAGLSSCFAQLTHKAQTIFQNSAKVEAELIDLRTELVNSKTRQEVLEEESRNLVLQLHSLQLDRLPSNQNPEQYKEKIETALKLSPSKSYNSDEVTFRNNSEVKKLKNELLQYQSENIILRNSILALHSEVYGARLAAKYLDKELAGRIQQLQLLGKEMRTDVRDKLWRQLESEILLHRHKTVIRACRNRTNHEFIPLDSRILNFSHSDERFLKKENVFRRQDSILKFEGHSNRRQECETRKKTDSDSQSSSADSLPRKSSVNLNNNYSKSRINNINNNNENNEEDDDSLSTSTTAATVSIPTTTTITNPVAVALTNTVNNNNDNSNKSDYIIEKGSLESNCNHIKENPDVGNGSVNELSQNCSGKIKTKDNNLNDKRESCDTERNEGKTEAEKYEKKESRVVKEAKKKSESPDVEDFLCPVGEKRSVIVKRQTGQGLGISITGGREHGVPILISELEVGGPAYECKNLFVGDAILKVNDISLENSSHFEAVKILTNLETNNVNLLVQFIAVDTDEENSLSEDLYGYRYRFFDTEVMDSSDALGLHPLHSKSAHTPTAPRTPELSRNDTRPIENCCQSESSACKPCNSSNRNEVFFGQKQNLVSNKEVDGKSENLIDIDTEVPKKEAEEESDKLKIDLFGFRFQTDITDVINYPGEENLLDDFLVKEPEPVKPETDLIQIEIPAESKTTTSPKKFEYVDENIFSGLDDHSILDNIMKSFSEDDFSYLDTEKEKTMTSDSGLEVCLSGSDNDGESRNYEEKYLNAWADNIPEKVELKTLQRLFDRSFSSNLSSPRGSTSFDDDILSTEHSDEKSNSVNEFKNKGRESRHNQYNSKKVQKCFSKGVGVTDDILRKSYSKSDSLMNLKNDILMGKKVKRNSSDSGKRYKSGRKSKENVRKDMKADKRKNSKELEASDLTKHAQEDTHKKREVNFKMTDRFEENLIEYNVKSFDVSQLSPERKPESLESAKKVEFLEDVSMDEIEETRKLSRKYGLKIPGKGVKADYNSMVVMTDVKSPERCLKVLENHFKHFKPVLEKTGKENEKEVKSKMTRNRYESFGDPDFGTPV